MKELEDDKKDIEVVEGNGDDLDISPVYDHVNVNRNQEKPKNIIIPKVNKDKEEKEEASDDSKKEEDNN